MAELFTGMLTGPVLGLQRLVAESVAFQRRTKAANDQDAKRHIKLFRHRDDVYGFRSDRPFAAIWPTDDADFDQYAGGSQIYMSAGGALMLYLTDFNRHPGDDEQSGLDFCSWVDEVMHEVAAGAGVSDRLPIRNIRLHLCPAPPRDQDRPTVGDYLSCNFVVSWKT